MAWVRQRSSRMRAAVIMTGLAASALAGGCAGKDPYSPGTKLGTFHVTAKLTQTTCGQTPDPWEFDVRINYDGATLYWIQGGAPIQGQIDPSARARLEASIVQELRAADARQRRSACSVSRTDVLAVTLSGADASPVTDPALATSFAGELVYTFAPAEGSDCSDQVSAAGGDFAALPCEVHYDLSASFKSPPP